MVGWLVCSSLLLAQLLLHWASVLHGAAPIIVTTLTMLFMTSDLLVFTRWRTPGVNSVTRGAFQALGVGLIAMSQEWALAAVAILTPFVGVSILRCFTASPPPP